MEKRIFRLFSCFSVILAMSTAATSAENIQARYDHYRVYFVELATEEHVKVFQKLEEISDSCTFYGHARQPGQKLHVMVAAARLADFDDLLVTYKVNYEILVSF